MKPKNKAFILITSLFILVLFSFLSITIIKNKTYSSKIDTLKYLEIQAKIHIKYIKNQLTIGIKSNEININDARYTLKIIDINNSYYDIYLYHNNEHIRIHDSLSLK